VLLVTVVALAVGISVGRAVGFSVVGRTVMGFADGLVVGRAVTAAGLVAVGRTPAVGWCGPEKWCAGTHCRRTCSQRSFYLCTTRLFLALLIMSH
jgi:hypothetical protein